MEILLGDMAADLVIFIGLGGLLFFIYRIIQMDFLAGSATRDNGPGSPVSEHFGNRQNFFEELDPRRRFSSFPLPRNSSFGGEFNYFPTQTRFSGMEDVSEFLAQLEDEFAMHEIEDAFRVRYAISSLRGNARQWWKYLRLMPDDLNWEQFKFRLRSQYSPLQSPLSIGRALISLTFRLNDNFETFAWKFRDLYFLWRPEATESELITSLLEQVPREIRFLFLNNELLSFLEVISRVKQYYPWRNNLQSGRNLEPENFRPRQEPARIRCYRCNGFGHIARQCPGNAPPRS